MPLARASRKGAPARSSIGSTGPRSGSAPSSARASAHRSENWKNRRRKVTRPSDGAWPDPDSGSTHSTERSPMPELKPGDPASDFDLPWTLEKNIRLSDLGGKKV